MKAPLEFDLTKRLIEDCWSNCDELFCGATGIETCGFACLLGTALEYCCRFNIRFCCPTGDFSLCLSLCHLVVAGLDLEFALGVVAVEDGEFWLEVKITGSIADSV